MNLYIDIGNSAIKFGVDNNSSAELIFFIVTKNIDREELANKLPKDIDNIYISSVVPNALNELSKVLKDIYNKDIIPVNTNDDSGVNIKIDNPKELGNDLLSDLAAASHFYGYPILVIDAGTATKILYIDEFNTFSSCAIVPGLEMQFKSLNSETAQLPLIEEKKVKKLLECHNTIDVITSSCFYSHIDMINGLIARYEKEIGHPVKKVVTGGHMKSIYKDLNFDYDYDPTLCLKGIKVIAERKTK